ncbi:MAG: GDP-L-fucose synthase [Bacteroidetes bacterium]|nr:GDP-L-fucose synthase [Bacteroidota bacterium]
MKDSKFYIAGHTGMVGTAILKNLVDKGYSNLVFTPHSDFDLTDQRTVQAFFKTERPEYVIVAAARVGGIIANNTYRAQFIYENLMIQNNIIHAAYQFGVNKLLFLGSSCIYPRDCPQPIKEEYLLNGKLEYTNEPYSVAKIAGLKMCENYYQQYKCNFISVMPTNLYGPNDDFNLETSHVLPALVHKLHEAKIRGGSSVEVWGSGTPKREFLYVDDCADACVHIFEKLSAAKLYSQGISHINIGSGKDISIADLVELIADIVGYDYDIKYDQTKPDGTPRKLLDISRLNLLGWQSKTDLSEGIQKTYNWYKDNISITN